MQNQFHFKNFEPEFQLRFQANIVLNRTLDIAPYGSVAIGLLEKRGNNDYCCALDIYSKQGPFMANALGATPEKALHCLEEKIKKQISWWKSHYGGPVPPRMAMGNPALVAP